MIAVPKGRPGYGDQVLVTSSTSGTTWLGVVLYWGTTGSPLVRDLDTGETRWFPVNWITELEPGTIPPCSCPPRHPGDLDSLEHTDRMCPEHGDADAIRKAAMKGEL